MASKLKSGLRTGEIRNKEETIYFTPAKLAQRNRKFGNPTHVGIKENYIKLDATSTTIAYGLTQTTSN